MISVVVPSYNQEQYLSDCIESILDQNVQMEIIVVDDGSTDNSLAIAKSYEPKVKVISQVNMGLASARNTGIMNAKYDFVFFLDADDMLIEGCLNTVIAVINNTNADIVAPSFKTFGISNEQIILMKDPKLEDFRSGNRIGYCCAIRKSKLVEVGGYSPKMVEGYEDLSLTCRLLVRGAKIITILEPLWLYRTKTESMWTKTKDFHDKLLAQINFDVPEAKLTFKHNAAN